MDSDYRFSGRLFNAFESPRQYGYGVCNNFHGVRENSQLPMFSSQNRPANKFSDLSYPQPLVTQENDQKLSASASWPQQLNANTSNIPPGFDQFYPPNPFKSPSTSTVRHHDATTQTQHDAAKEKLHLCESILTGCAEMKKIIPIVANTPVSESADSLEESVMAMYLSSNICSQQTPDATEVTIITEYAKSFVRMAECWLGTRNCFGMSDRCSGLCRLEVGDLTANYVEWMHSSRRLLSSILSGLQKMNMMYMSDPSVYSGEDEGASDQGSVWNAGVSVPRQEEVPKFSPKYVPPNLRNKPKNPPLRKYAGQSCPLLPVPPQAFVSEAPSTSEYMKPSSYNVPRNELTQSKKRMNLNAAKSDIVNGAIKEKGAYIVGLAVAPEAKDEDRVFQIKPRGSKSEGFNEQNSQTNPKFLVPGHCSAAKNQTLPPSQLIFMSEMVRYFSTCDFPSVPKEKAKSSKYHKSVELIMNKVQNSLYESIEQFIYDCRRFFLTMSCKSGKEGQVKMFRIRCGFEDSLRKEFPDCQKWDHINGEMRKGDSSLQTKISEP